MAQSNPNLKTFRTATDMSATDYRFVKMSADTVVVLSGAGEAIIGIRQDSPDGSVTAKDVNVAISGTSKLTLGDTVTVGAYLKSDAAGAGVPSTTDTEIYGAIALEAGVVGQVIEVLVKPSSTLSA